MDILLHNLNKIMESTSEERQKQYEKIIQKAHKYVTDEFEKIGKKLKKKNDDEQFEFFYKKFKKWAEKKNYEPLEEEVMKVIAKGCIQCFDENNLRSDMTGADFLNSIKEDLSN